MIKQHEHYDKARKVMPGGVNSSTRLLRTTGMPFYASQGRGSRISDIDGKEYLDMCCAHGAGLLGNAHPAIHEALRKAGEMGYLNSHESALPAFTRLAGARGPLPASAMDPLRPD